MGQLSCFIFPDGVGFEARTWDIGYFRWWSRSVGPPSILYADFHYVLVASRKGIDLQSLCARILDDLACISQNPVNVTLVPHILEVLYVVGSLLWTWIHQPFC